MLKILLCLGMLSAGACTIYRADIQQGNVLEDVAIQKLKLGMTRKQVSFILGTPLLQDPFHADRWDYIYTFKPGNGVTTRQLLVLFFKDDSLSKIDDSRLAKQILPE